MARGEVPAPITGASPKNEWGREGKGETTGTTHGNEQFAQDDLAEVQGDRATRNTKQKHSELFAVLHRETLPARGQKRRVDAVGRVPIAGDLDLGSVCAEELHVRVGVLEQEGHDESPGLPSALQLEKFGLEAALVVRREAVCGHGVV